jgi:peptidoglycan/xylan/chitin deacetylase (PgdA/CDA1 family)
MRIAKVVAVFISISLVFAWVVWLQTHVPLPTAAPGQATVSAPARPLSLDLFAQIPTVAARLTVSPDQPLATPPPPSAAAPTPGAAPRPAAAAASTCPGNPNALGVSRVVEIDATGGPGFGWEHFKIHDFLRNREVVLTFDDGPWPGNTPAVLRALADHCTKATFFPIGKHATYYPEILKQVLAAGHTVGSHTWAHKDLSRKPYDSNLDLAKEEIEKGISAVRMALGTPEAPFFRFPALKHPPELVTYLGERNIAIFSTDMDSFDFTMRRPEQVIKSVMAKLEKHGKGIVLMHDFQHPTSEAVPELLNLLKGNGYKVVQMRAKEPVKTLAQYDAEVAKEMKLPTVSSRPTSLVVRTISD